MKPRRSIWSNGMLLGLSAALVLFVIVYVWPRKDFAEAAKAGAANCYGDLQDSSGACFSLHREAQALNSQYGPASNFM